MGIETTTVDAKWYPQFEEAGAFEDYEFLGGDKAHRNEQKMQFMAGEIANPTLDYPKLDIDNLNNREKILLELKYRILEEEPNEIIKQSYRWKINEKIAEIRMLRATASGDMRRFQRYSEFIYGKPSLDVFVYTLNNLRVKTREQLKSTSIEIRQAAEALLSVLPEDIVLEGQGDSSDISESNANTSFDFQGIGGDSAMEIGLMDSDEAEVGDINLDVDGLRPPSKATFGFAKKQTESGLTQLVDNIEEQGFGGDSIMDLGLSETDTLLEGLGARELKEIFEMALNMLQAVGWTAVIDSTSGNKGINVSQEKREVIIPKTRRLLLGKLQKILVHEIGTHVRRRLAGQRSVMMLLQLGFDRYAGGEEGIAVMREQVLNESFKNFGGMIGYLSAGLAYGLDGKPRDFREVYNILEKYYVLQALIGPDEIEDEEVSSPPNKAWGRAVRTFRGTNCKTPGVCHTRDIIYRKGNIGIWRVIGTNPDELMRFNVGKYDPANPRHIWILNQLGITDTDLDELEK